MKIHSRALLGLLVLAGSAGGVLLACSSDDDTTATTIDAGSDSATGDATVGTNCPPQATPACSAASCTAQFGGDAGFCVDGACVQAISQDCARVGGDLTGSNQVVLGAMLLTNSTGPSRANSFELAINEINKAGGIPDPDSCKPARTLAYVYCDDLNATGTTVADGGTDRIRGAKHLVNDLKVPMIIGGSNSTTTPDIATNVTDPAKVMLFAPSTTAASVTTLAGASPDGTRLLWRTAPSDNAQALAIQKVLAEVATSVGAPKIALVTNDGGYGVGLAASIQNGLTIGGAAPTAANFKAISFQAATDGSNPTGLAIPQSQAVQALVNFQPTIVIMVGTAEATNGVLIPYERTSPPSAPKYILADGQKKDDLVTTYFNNTTNTGLTATQAASLHARLRGTQPGVVTQQLTQNFFSLGYKTAYGASSLLSYGMAGSYDIGYMIGYAIAATKGGAVTGTALAQNMSLLVGGSDGLDVGSAALPKGMSAMLQGTKVDFNGASGPLDFDLTTGEALSDYSVWCVKDDPNNAGKYLFEEVAGEHYDSKTSTLIGTYACP